MYLMYILRVLVMGTSTIFFLSTHDNRSDQRHKRHFELQYRIAWYLATLKIRHTDPSGRISEPISFKMVAHTTALIFLDISRRDKLLFSIDASLVRYLLIVRYFPGISIRWD